MAEGRPERAANSERTGFSEFSEDTVRIDTRKGTSMDTNKPESSRDGRKAGRGPERPSSGVSSIRRTLVKTGVFVPPIVLTLRSGTAIAQSSAGSCLTASQAAAQEAAENNELVPKEVPDEWLRARILVKEARRVRKRQGEWTFKGRKIVRVYAHENSSKDSFLSLRAGRSGRKWRLMDSGRTIEIRDPQTHAIVLAGSLMYRGGNPRRRFIAIAENEALGVVETDDQGQIVLDEDGNPSIVEIVDAAQPVAAITASCWASLNPSVGA